VSVINEFDGLLVTLGDGHVSKIQSKTAPV
jgi:hypothetical protein